MAKKKKKPAAAADQNGKASPGEEKKLDATELRHEVEEAMDEFTGWDSDVREQERKIQELEEQLVVEREKLECLARPLRRIHNLLRSPDLVKLKGAMPYDSALMGLVGKLHYKRHSWEAGGGKSTGAIAWKDLKAHGATDAQIQTNLKSVVPNYSFKYRLEIRDKIAELRKHNASGQDTPVIAGMPALVKEIRRVFGIGAPVAQPAAKKSKQAEKPQTKSAAAKPKKKSGSAAEVLPEASQQDSGGTGKHRANTPYNEANARAAKKKKSTPQKSSREKSKGIQVLHDGSNPRPIVPERTGGSDESSARRLPSALAK